jgi:hypothetical protein
VISGKGLHIVVSGGVYAPAYATVELLLQPKHPDAQRTRCSRNVSGDVYSYPFGLSSLFTKIVIPKQFLILVSKGGKASLAATYVKCFVTAVCRVRSNIGIQWNGLSGSTVFQKNEAGYLKDISGGFTIGEATRSCVLCSCSIQGNRSQFGCGCAARSSAEVHRQTAVKTVVNLPSSGRIRIQPGKKALELRLCNRSGFPSRHL